MISIFLANGIPLDTDSDTSIGFKYDNPYFTGADNTVPHTYEFTIPPTDRNTQMLGLDRHYEMQGVRHKMKALLCVDDIREWGNLYLLQWDGGRYCMMFEYGRPDDILKENLSAWWQPSNRILVVDKEEIPAGGTIPDFGWYGYNNGYANTTIEVPIPCFPVANLGSMLTNAATAAGYSITYPDAVNYPYQCADNFGLILGMDTYIDSTVNLTNWVPLGGDASMVTVTGGGTLASVGLSIGTKKMKRGAWGQKKYVSCFIALRPLKIEFDGNYSSVAVVQGKGYDFLNEEPALNNLIVHPNCSFDLDTGDYFTCVETSDWDPAPVIPANPYWLATAYTTSLTCKFKVKEADTLPVAGDYIYLQDNLPDMSFLDLLKAYCNLTNCYYTYNAGSGVFAVRSRDTLSYTNITDVESMGVTKRGAILRYIEGYAQHNGVECKSADYVPDGHKFKILWDCDNDSLEEEASLAQVPFNEGDWVLNAGSE